MSDLTHIPEELRNEFTVDNESGKTYATISAVARLCGITKSFISDARLRSNGVPRGLLQQLKHAANDEAFARDLSEPLKPFVGFDYEAFASIPDTVATGIIAHLALLGKEEAIKTQAAFASIGFRTWVQHELGYSDQNQTQMLNQILSELQELKETQKKYNSISDRVDDQQGLKEILADYEADKEALNSDYYTLRSWLEEKGIQLNNRALRKLANRVAHTYRTHYREAPRQVRAYQAGEEGKTNLVNVYRVSDEPLIRAAFKQCFR